MTHLTEYSSVRRGYALDRLKGAVRIESDVHGGLSVFVNVLRCNLTVFRK